jgi:hypothetical protein
MSFKEYVTTQLFNLYLKYIRYTGSITYKKQDKYDFESQIEK